MIRQMGNFRIGLFVHAYTSNKQFYSIIIILCVWEREEGKRRGERERERERERSGGRREEC